MAIELTTESMMKGKRNLVTLAVVVLGGCSGPPSNGDETARRVSLCQEVMKKYIVQAKIYERDRERLIGSCQISQKERSLEQWQCVSNTMDQGVAYVEASDRCGRLQPAAK